MASDQASPVTLKDMASPAAATPTEELSLEDRLIAALKGVAAIQSCCDVILNQPAAESTPPFEGCLGNSHKLLDELLNLHAQIATIQQRVGRL